MNTKSHIIQTARELYNEYGLKNVTARKICGVLGISLGSYSYHFPKSKGIVKELYLEYLRELNDLLFSFTTGSMSVTRYLEFHHTLFLLQEKYKFIFINLFEILSYYNEVKDKFLENTKMQREISKSTLILLRKKGFLSVELTDHQIENVLNAGQVLNNFWVLDSEITNPENKSKYYVEISCGLIKPFLTEISKSEYYEYFLQHK